MDKRDVEGIVLAAAAVGIVAALLLAGPVKNLVTRLRVQHVHAVIALPDRGDPAVRTAIEAELREHGFTLEDAGWPQMRVTVRGCSAAAEESFGLVEMALVTSADESPAFWSGARSVERCTPQAVSAAVRDMTVMLAADRDLPCETRFTNPRALGAFRATR